MLLAYFSQYSVIFNLVLDKALTFIDKYGRIEGLELDSSFYF